MKRWWSREREGDSDRARVGDRESKHACDREQAIESEDERKKER